MTKRLGRPPKTRRGDVKTEIVGCRCTRTERRRLHRIALAQGKTLTDLFRWYAEQLLKGEKQ